MKLFHLADLHLGKRLRAVSFLEEQEHILKEVLNYVDAERPDAVILAGDVYDRAVPSEDAVRLFDWFLCALARERSVSVLLISGNHDSAERVAFGGRLLGGSGVHISPVYGGKTEPVVLTDAFGPVNFYLLPFLKPAEVRRFFEGKSCESYTDAVALAVESMRIDPSGRNVLVTHQFIAGSERCDSEEMSVGGTDNVDVSAVECFDYVALGHLHGPQQAGRAHVRYCGSPLKYSFSEEKQHKSVTVVELGEKGALSLRFLPLTPLHDMRTVRGTYAELTAPDYYQVPPASGYRSDYLRIVLTDEEEVPDAMALLKMIYPNALELEYDNKRSRTAAVIEEAVPETKSPDELFGALYEQQNGQSLTGEERGYILSLLEKLKGENA